MEKYSFKHLDWDTEFFGIPCARASLLESLTEKDFEKLFHQCKDYGFVTIENTCGAFSNDFYLGNNSKAYLADCAVTLKKQSSAYSPRDFGDIKIRCATEEDLPWITEIAGNAFVNSRFFNDPEITDVQVSNLYKSWVKNAMTDENKVIFVTEDKNGFVIYLQDGDQAHINLIATGGVNRKNGVGTALVKYADNYAFKNGCNDFFVGTQSSNIPAINLYTKCGFKFLMTTRTYHLRSK